MAPSRATRRTALGAALALAAGSLVAGGVATAASHSAGTPSCGALFDDFAYASSSDPGFTGNGWSARSTAGGPGVPGATWSPGNITFPTVDGQKVAQLAASTDGTASGTTQAEFLQTRLRFFEGTYASRIKFHDVPASGPDGDHVNETFFTIGPPQRFDYDPLYSELDFSEYLPNGGWGVTGSIDYQTSWNGYKEDPWDPHNAHSQEATSFDGWHDVVSQVAGGHVKYYMDGVLVGDHTVDDKTGTYPVYPRVPMSLNYNLWFIDTAAHTGGVSTYDEQVDWVYYAKNTVLSPADAVSRAATYRSTGTSHEDTLDASSCPDPITPPTTAPPTTAPSTVPPTTPADCSHASEWSAAATYNTGDRVVHERSVNGDPNGPKAGGKHLWQANWWTQGSEPGWTAQWRDLGHC